MKMIVVAAGQGTRLRPLTNDVPKCMVKYNDKSIINYIIETANSCGVKDIAIINGYKKEVLEKHLENDNVKFFTNEKYDQTNMVSTLFCAKEYMDDDIIISYADIIYKKEVLEQLIQAQNKVNVVVDKKWKELWSLRMDNPLEDAETLKTKDGNIIELGKKPNSYDEIEGQYIGLIKIKKELIQEIISFYESLDQNALYDGKDFDNMYMTSFIQMIIDQLANVSAVEINGGWIEIDSVEDLNSYLEKGIAFE